MKQTRIRSLRKQYKELLLACANFLTAYRHTVSRKAATGIHNTIVYDVDVAIEHLETVFMKQTKNGDAADLLNTAVIPLDEA